ncbi:MAG: CapA family protein [Deltaproteobacteria bacterium]|nr:CapA family protein [Deltaproteobacteria bacterium]
MKRWMSWLRGARAQGLLADTAVALVTGAVGAQAWGYVKDDSYITFRYARNAAEGLGLVFNAGEAVEGYTNFLWTVLMVPVVASGADPLPFAAALGLLLSAAAGVLTRRAAVALGAAPWAALAAALAFGLWPAVSIWSVSGMEMGLVELTAAWTLLAFIRAWSEPDARGWWALAGLGAALSCLTRPEPHAIALFLALAGAARARRAVWPMWLVLGGIVLPYHAWRLWFFGDPLPNTFYVKGGSGFLFWRIGLDYVWEMVLFGGLGLTLALALGAVGTASARSARWLRAILAALPLFFIAYLIKVGGDELRWYRLFLPVWPAVAALAGVAISELWGRRRWAGGLAMAALAAQLGLSLWESSELLPRHQGYVVSTRNNHAAVGKYLTRHAAPGATVAFQDMGSTPFHAPDLYFVDTIGLVDRHMAHLHHDMKVNPFVKDHYRATPEGRRHLQRFYRAGRDYLMSRDPDWVVYVARPDAVAGSAARKLLGRRPWENPVDKYLGDVTFYYGWAREPAFRERYAYVRSWPRASGYWLTLWRRRDLGEAPEVRVRQAVPDSPLLPHLSNGVVFLQSWVQEEAFVGGELTVESLFSTPGPRAEETLVEIRLLRDGATRPALLERHVPGDWLWRADQWRAGEVVRDQVLLLIPDNAVVGDYEIAWRMVDGRSGRPVGIEGSADGWVPLGRTRVDERSWWDPARVPQTDPEALRALHLPVRPPVGTGGAQGGLTLAVGGDTMLGRRQNAVFARQGAEAALGGLTPLREADLSWVNLESVVSGLGDAGAEKGERGPYYYRGRPELLDTLTAAGVDVVSNANNHAGDYGPEALLDQSRLLDAAGIHHAGAGSTWEEACAPARVEVAGKVLALFSVDATKQQFAAEADAPGTCYLSEDDPAGWTAHFEPRVAAARAWADHVLVGVHWGPNNVQAPTPQVRALARALAGTGVDAVIGSSSHLLHGVEVIEGVPVLFDTGNLLFDSSNMGEGAQSAVFTLHLGRDGVTGIEAWPVVLRHGRTELAEGADLARIVQTLRARSEALGTRWQVTEGGRVILELGLPAPAPARAPASDPVRTPPLASPPPACVVEALPEDARRIEVDMGPVTLLGVRYAPERLSGRELVTVESFWRLRAGAEVPTRDWLINARLEPSSGDQRWVSDHQPCDWAWPMDRWQQGVIYRDSHAIRPPQRLRPDTWTVSLGLADPYGTKQTLPAREVGEVRLER